MRRLPSGAKADLRETNNAKRAFEDYLAMGDGRSLRKLQEHYRQRNQEGTKSRSPTVRMSTLREWSMRHHWQARIAEIDAQQVALDRQEYLKQLAAQRKVLVKTLSRQSDIVAELWEMIDPKRISVDSARALQQAAQATATTAKLIMSMAGDPIAERVEYTGTDGRPIQHIGFHGTPQEFARALQAMQASEPELAGEIISDMVVKSTIEHIGRLLPAPSGTGESDDESEDDE